MPATGLTPEAARGPRDHREAHAGPGLPAVGPRDRRGGRPHLAVDRPRPPGRPAEARLPAPRPHQAPGDRGPVGPDLRRRHRAPARCATCPSSATWPPAPTCSPRRTSRSCCPLPADFTGDGELFMLRVRGDSMIDAGILDGDYVVCRSQSTADERRHRRRRHPRRRGDGQDVHDARATRSCCCLPTPGSSPMEFEPDRGPGLRPGRHGPAAALTGLRPRAATQLADAVRSRSRRAAERAPASPVDVLVAGVGERRSRRPEVRGRDAGGGEAADVGPAQLRPHLEPVAVAQRCQHRVRQAAAARPSATSTSSTVSPSSR